MRRTEGLQLLPEEQSSLWKIRRSVLTALNKILVTDFSRQSRLLLTINSNDDQAYHDRIILWIASFTLQKIWVSKEAEFSTTNTLQSKTYDINMVFGVSIETYSPSTTNFK